MAVKIIIDSASDITVSEARERGAELISMEIMFGSEVYLDGDTLDSRKFFEKLIECDDLPKTSQINEYRWEEIFSKHVANGDEVVAIVISSKLSGTYASAQRAAKKFDGKVFVLDSLNACIGERILFDYALRLKEEGKSAKEIFTVLDCAKKQVRVLALLGTLKYLKKGGRISPFVAFVGETLNMKPVVGVINGEVKLIGKAIGSKKGNNYINTLIKNGKGVDFTKPFACGYSGLDDTVMRKYIEDSKKIWEGQAESVPFYRIGSTIGTHVGPGAVAVAFFEKE